MKIAHQKEKEKQDDDNISSENIPLNPQENVHVKGILEDNLEDDKDNDLSRQIKQNKDLPDIRRQSGKDNSTDDLNHLLNAVKSSEPPNIKDKLEPFQKTGSTESKELSKASELVSQSLKENLNSLVKEESPSFNKKINHIK